MEWKRRSWGLLGNRGQVEVDNFTLVGSLGGVLTAAVVGMGGLKGMGRLGSLRSLGWRGVVGAVGVGNVMGVVGYMGWRYGVKGGKWEEKETRKVEIGI